MLNGTCQWPYLNKTGLQPVSRNVELVHYFKGLGGARQHLGCRQTHKQTDRTGVASGTPRKPHLNNFWKNIVKLVSNC